MNTRKEKLEELLAQRERQDEAMSQIRAALENVPVDAELLVPLAELEALEEATRPIAVAPLPLRDCAIRA